MCYSLLLITSLKFPEGALLETCSCPATLVSPVSLFQVEVHEPHSDLVN